MNAPGMPAIFVPKPHTLVPVGYCTQIRETVAHLESIDEIDEGRRRIAAIETYVRDRAQRNEAQGAQRWCEARIGELLGAPSFAGPGRGKPSNALEGLSADERYWFRRLADHVDVIEQGIADGKTSRAAILALIQQDEIKERGEQRGQEDDGTKYDVIVIDPPWPMAKIERDVAPNQAGLDYPPMSLDKISSYPIPAAEHCHLWLWTTHKFLPDALRILEDDWKFRYVCTFVWHKPGGFQPFGLPQYNCEFAIYARRGTPAFVDTKDFPVCFSAPRGAHSEKPQVFYDTVRRVTEGLRVDIFNRRPIEGFAARGYEAP